MTINMERLSFDVADGVLSLLRAGERDATNVVLLHVIP